MYVSDSRGFKCIAACWEMLTKWRRFLSDHLFCRQWWQRTSDKSEVKVNQGLGIFQNQDSAEDERITIYFLVNWVLPQHFPLFSLGSATCEAWEWRFWGQLHLSINKISWGAYMTLEVRFCRRRVHSDLIFLSIIICPYYNSRQHQHAAQNR